MSLTAEELFDNFALLPDWEERYRYLIDLGRQTPPLPEADKTQTNKVEGCMSQVWMTALPDPARPGAIQILADSDAHIVKGLAAVLVILFSGKTPDEIASIDVQEAFTRLGLGEHLSPNRRNGFFSMVDRIKRFASQVA